MFALSLSHPLWLKLDDAHRDRNIPNLIETLSSKWDEAAASSLFWDCLCHQDSCYGATFASIPHLLEIAKFPPSPGAVQDIAAFLGHVALVAFQTGERDNGDDPSKLQGLPLALKAWDQKLEPYRFLAERARMDLEDPHFPENLQFDKLEGKPEISEIFSIISDLTESRTGNERLPDEESFSQFVSRDSRKAELDRYLEILSRPPLDEQEMVLIEKIHDAFLSALPDIADVCAHAYERATDPSTRRHFLSGVAAAGNEPELAFLFESGDEGSFCCKSCGWGYSFVVYGPRVACYASGYEPGEPQYGFRDDPSVLDYEDGAPNRADGFVEPLPGKVTESPAAARIFNLVSATNDRENLSRLQNYLGTYSCKKCTFVTSLI